MSHDLTAHDDPRRLSQSLPARTRPAVDLLEIPPPLTSRAGRRGSREKFAAGMRGLKHAIRGDSSFFAHAYRGTLIALTAAITRALTRSGGVCS